MRQLVIGGALPAALATAMITTPMLSNIGGAAPAPSHRAPAFATAPDSSHLDGMDFGPRASMSRLAVSGATASVRGLSHAAPKPTEKSLARITDGHFKKCSDPNHGGICEDPTHDPNTYAIGFELPGDPCLDVDGYCIPKGAAITEDYVDVTAVCPIVTNVPYTVCQKGF